MIKRRYLMSGKVFFMGCVCIYALAGLFTFFGCKHPTNSEHTRGAVYTVSGTISSNIGAATNGAVVQLKQNYADSVGAPVTVDSAGAYTISGVKPGAGYRIQVSHQDHYTSSGALFNVDGADVTGQNLELINLSMFSPDNFSLDDLAVNTNVAKITFLDNHGDYSGNVVKVEPDPVPNWSNYSRPIYHNLGNISGLYKITIAMSVWAEVTPAGRCMYNGPPNLGIAIYNGKNFNDSPWDQAVGLKTGEWMEIAFSRIADFCTSENNGEVYIEGLGESQGLVNLTLFIRHYTLTVQKYDGKKYIALTFDDGPSDVPGALHTTDLLDKLDELGIKASFFLVGMRIDALDPLLDKNLTPAERAARRTARQALVRRMFDEGHDVANHSYTHNYLGGHTAPEDEGIPSGDIPDITGIPGLEAFDNHRQWPLSKAAIDNEVQACQDAIQKAVYGDADYKNHPPVSNFFRTPFTADAQYAIDLITVAKEKGLPIIYGPGSSDYDSTLSPEQIADRILNRIPGAIIINHDPNWAGKIIDALALVVPQLKTDGYEIVTLSEMIKKMGVTLIPGQVYESIY